MLTSKQIKMKVPISPMIDIIFLMIFFFVLSAVMDDGINNSIDLVKVKNGKPGISIPKKIFISVSESGDIYLDSDVPVTHAFLGKSLKSIINTWGSNTTFIVRADKDTMHEEVDNALQELKECGAHHIILSGENISK